MRPRYLWVFPICCQLEYQMCYLRKHSKDGLQDPQLSVRVFAALKQGQSASPFKLKHKEKLLQVSHNNDSFPLDICLLPLLLMLNVQQWSPALDLGRYMFIWCVFLLGSFNIGPSLGRRGKQKCSFDACLRADHHGSQYHTSWNFPELSSHTDMTAEVGGHSLQQYKLQPDRISPWNS